MYVLPVKTFRMKLEQLGRLRSKDTPRRLMIIHTMIQIF